MNHRNLIRNLVRSVVLVCATAAPLLAVPFNFNFGGSGGTASSYAFTSGALNVTVTASAWDGSAWRSASVGRYSAGLGVTNSSGSDNGSPQHATDANGWNDYLIFHFSASVDVSSVLLGWVNNDSDFRYWIGNTLTDVRTTTGGIAVSGGSSPNWYSINGGNLVGTYFSIAANPSQSNDYFKVKKVYGDYTTSVPDDSGTFALLGIGIVGVTALRRRRSKHA
jgi:hypothetical protein